MKKTDSHSLIQRILRRTLGLDPAAVNLSDFEQAVAARMAQHGIRSRVRYMEILRCSRKERQSLVETVRLPQTSFFQDPETLSSLKRWVACHWLPRPSKKPLRLLNVPATTGEEAYSLAITLLESGLQAHQFHIDAVDVNDRALRIAASASYPASAMVTAPESLQDRYFLREQNGFRISGAVRSQVSFLKTDLEGSKSMSGPYDIIFGRRLMRFFAASAQGRILRGLEKALKPGGLLIVGGKPEPKKSKGAPAGWSTAQAPISPVQEVQERVKLKEAGELIESRRFDEAAWICVNVLAIHRACAQAVCLLGKIAQAEGRLTEAREFFRRALYLQPRLRPAIQALGQCPPWLPHPSTRRRSS
ncbi:MAG: hypothetical protein FJ405_01600 [Verrucomicrobia bacterium]|nr:hypothetical protein [Verrucomicrobiota bacterium]